MTFYKKVEEHRVKYVAPAIQEMNGAFLCGAELRTGHAIQLHVGLTEADLKNRMNVENKMQVSSFTSMEDAEKIVTMILEDEDNQNDIAEWLLHTNERDDRVLSLPEDVVMITGISLKRGEDRTTPTLNACVVLRKNNSEIGWDILTAYPVAELEGLTF
jgi:hypothetical protein